MLIHFNLRANEKNVVALLGRLRATPATQNTEIERLNDMTVQFHVQGHGNEFVETIVRELANLHNDTIQQLSSIQKSITDLSTV